MSLPISVVCQEIFQPTPPAQGATFSRHVINPFWKFQPTPPAQGATLKGHKEEH